MRPSRLQLNRVKGSSAADGPYVQRIPGNQTVQDGTHECRPSWWIRAKGLGWIDRLTTMEVSLLSFDGCPHHAGTALLLAALLDEAGWTGDIRLVNVDSPERADELGFRGSPTVWLDGVDPFLDAEAPVGLSCRIYATESGCQGTPPELELRTAIARRMGA